MEAARVRAILPVSELLPMAGIRAGLLGVTTLKGQSVAVIDLCRKLGLPPASPGPQPKIVILELNSDDGRHMAGFIADRVSEVVTYRERDRHDGILKGKAARAA